MKMPGLACLLPQTAIAVAAVVLSLAAPALAQGTNQGTEEERRACTPDVMRLCREFIPNVAAITQCLIDRRAELNPACKLVMTPKPDPVRAASTARKRTAAKRTAKPPAAAARTVSAEPGEVIRPPMNIVPPAAAAKPTKRKAKPASARSAAVAPGGTQKKRASGTP